MSHADQRQVNRYLWRADRRVEAFHKDFKEGHEVHISCVGQVAILQPAVDASIGGNGISVGVVYLELLPQYPFFPAEVSRPADILTLMVDAAMSLQLIYVSMTQICPTQLRKWNVGYASWFKADSPNEAAKPDRLERTDTKTVFLCFVQNR